MEINLILNFILIFFIVFSYIEYKTITKKWLIEEFIYREIKFGDFLIANLGNLMISLTISIIGTLIYFKTNKVYIFPSICLLIFIFVLIKIQLWKIFNKKWNGKK